MAKLKISQVDTGNISGVDWDDMAAGQDTTVFTDFYKVANLDTDGPSGQEETTYQANWTKWHGYYRKIPEFQAVIDKLASWSVGKGYKADNKTMKQLNRIKGWGKDDFNSIIENLLRASLIAGDSFAEIIRDKAGRLINLKPLNPGSVRIVVNKKGILLRYEQVAQVGEEKVIIPFKKDMVLHLAWNRIADEIHGIPIGEKLENLMLMRNESLADMRVIFHRNAIPVQIIPIDTDDATEIASIKTKWKTAYKKAEPIFVPKDTFDIKNMIHYALPNNSSLDPLPYLQYLIRVFTTSSGVPEIIMGWGGDVTEASSKIIYLAFQQTIERLQRWMEAQLKLQTGIKIELEFPASIEPSLIKDEKKDTPLNEERRSELQP